MAERLSDEHIRVLKESLDGVNDRGDAKFIEIFQQALNVVLGEKEWVELPSGRSFRLNTGSEPERFFMLPPMLRPEAILEVRDPAMDDWARHHGVQGRNIETGEITELP